MMNGRKAMLELVNLSKSFGKFKALDDISLKVEKGEVMGFIGPNGAGKSTTIRLIIGALKANTGKIIFDGKDIKNDKNYLEKIAYVPGDVNLWNNLTGGEVINFMMAVKGNKDTERKNDLLKRFKLDPKKKCKNYSKGNRQKVALISAFLSDADFYIFDEPTTGLDPLMEREFHKEILTLKSQGKTVLLSSHILSEVEKLVDSLAIIKDCQIIETGSFEDLRHITRVEYIIRTDDNIDALRHQKFIKEFYNDHDGYHFLVDNEDIPDFLKYLKIYNLHVLEMVPIKLEDIFLKYYQGET